VCSHRHNQCHNTASSSREQFPETVANRKFRGKLFTVLGVVFS
jgi:hypothetical protein